nr:hypothetical protein [Ktedonobacteraceae bacterium]
MGNADNGHYHIHAYIPPTGQADKSAVAAINRALQLIQGILIKLISAGRVSHEPRAKSRAFW